MFRFGILNPLLYKFPDNRTIYYFQTAKNSLFKSRIKNALTEIIWYELDIMAMSMLSNTMILMTEYEPNMSKAQNRVKPLIPVKSNTLKSTNPKLAQKSDWDVSNKLKKKSKILWIYILNF